MKTAVIFFLLGGIAGAFALMVYQQHETSSLSSPSSTYVTTPNSATTSTTVGDKTRDTLDNVGAKTRDAVHRTGDAIEDKLAEWHLTGDDIKADLAKTGQVIREKSEVAGEKISDARIVTVIKSKYVLDSNLSALDISVDCSQGDVTLQGAVASPDLIGRAMALALDTKGVRHVVSKLAIK